jgi:hypothetical protein
MLPKKIPGSVAVRTPGKIKEAIYKTRALMTK